MMRLNLQMFASGSTRGGGKGKKSGSSNAKKRFVTRGKKRTRPVDNETPW